MGSLPQKTIAKLVASTFKDIYKTEVFVETGTYKGTTTEWASENFSWVYTIDISQEYLDNARLKLESAKNIFFKHGDSRVILEEVVPNLSSNAVFWLDAHKGGGYFGSGDDCPIIEEILAIHKHSHQNCILIDDVRAFLFPPQPPFDYKKWPTISEILRTLDLKERRFNFIVEDVLLSVPIINSEKLVSELHELYPKFR